MFSLFEALSSVLNVAKKFKKNILSFIQFRFEELPMFDQLMLVH